MPDMAAGMVIQTRFEYEILGQKDLTVWHWNVKTAQAGNDMLNFLGNDLNASLLGAGSFVPTLMNLMSDQATLTAVVSQVIHPTRYHGVRSIAAVQGGDATPLGTNNLALSIGYSGILAGRGKSGRTQVPGLPKKYIIDGFWDAAIRVPVYNLFSTWRTQDWAVPGGKATLTPILFDPQSAGKNAIVDATSYRTVRVMRRRTVGVGQ